MKRQGQLKYSSLLIIIFLIATSLLLVACSGGAQAQETFSIGVINYLPPLERTLDGFKTEMAELGYIEGENVTYIYNGTIEPNPTVIDAEIESLLNQGYPSVPPVLEVLRPTAASLGITLVEVPATSPADIQADLQARAQSGDIGIDAILTIPEPINVNPDALAAISKFAVEHNVPVAAASISVDGHGVVLGNLSDNFEVGELAASLANQIFKGNAAGTIPVVSPESYVHINYKVAQELGLAVPEGILSQAEEIIR